MNAVHAPRRAPVNTSWHRGPDWLLPLVLLIEGLVYFAAVALHLGLRLAVGPLTLAAPHVLLPAAIAETIIGVVVLANLAAVLAGAGHARAITPGAHVFALLGVLLGLAVLAAGSGLGLDLNFDLHYVMLIGIAAAFGLVLTTRRPGRERS